MSSPHRIRVLRKERGYTQAALAQKLGVSESTVRMWELNKNEPDHETLLNLSKIFQCSVDYILENPHFENEQHEEIVILNRATRKMTPEQRKQLLNIAKVMFKEEFDE